MAEFAPRVQEALDYSEELYNNGESALNDANYAQNRGIGPATDELYIPNDAPFSNEAVPDSELTQRNIIQVPAEDEDGYRGLIDATHRMTAHATGYNPADHPELTEFLEGEIHHEKQHVDAMNELSPINTFLGLEIQHQYIDALGRPVPRFWLNSNGTFQTTVLGGLSVVARPKKLSEGDKSIIGAYGRDVHDIKRDVDNHNSIEGNQRFLPPLSLQ